MLVGSNQIWGCTKWSQFVKRVYVTISSHHRPTQSTDQRSETQSKPNRGVGCWEVGNLGRREGDSSPHFAPTSVLLVTLTSGYPGFTFLVCRNKVLTLGFREEMGEDSTSAQYR